MKKIIMAMLASVMICTTMQQHAVAMRGNMTAEQYGVAMMRQNLGVDKDRYNAGAIFAIRQAARYAELANLGRNEAAPTPTTPTPTIKSVDKINDLAVIESKKDSSGVVTSASDKPNAVIEILNEKPAGSSYATALVTVAGVGALTAAAIYYYLYYNQVTGNE